MKKRVLSLILAVMLTVSIIPFTGITTLASDPPKITEAELQAKFATLRTNLENKYFTVNQTYCHAAPGEPKHPPQNDCSNCKNTNVYNASWFPLMTPQDHPENMPKHYCPGGGSISSVGWSCAGFATYAQWYLYASRPGDYVVSEKKGGDISISYDNLKSVGAHIGDVIRTRDSDGGGHSVVLYSYNSSGLSYIQCNGTRPSDGNCKVTFMSNRSYSEFANSFGGTVCVTGCKNFSSATSTYTISYNANGGSGAPGNQTKTHGINLTLSSTKPMRDGYTFLGWATSANATSATYSAGGTYSANSGATLYAVWRINVINVYYNANGGKVGNSAYGYTADANGLLSKYQTINYGKTFGQNGLFDVDSEAFDLGRTGYHITGGKEWKAENGALLNQNDSSHTAINVASLCGKDLAKGDVNVTLYVNWIPNSYTVSFNANGGNCSSSSKTVNYDGTYGTLPTPTKDGYGFVGWFTAASGGTQISSSSKVSVTSNQTLYAHWNANSYSVSYNANGGSGAPGNQTKTYGTNLTLSTTTPTRAGYAFQGWATSANATSAAYQPGSSYTSNAAVTLYAVWKPYVLTVYYNSNGGVIGNTTYNATADSNGLLSVYDTAEYGKTFGAYGLTNVDSEVFDLSKTGYHLLPNKEWKADNGAQLSQGDNTYTAQQVASLCGKDLTKGDVSVTLYANWIANTYRIEYNLDGGSFEHEPGGMYEWIQNTGANITQQINPMITCYDGFYNGSNIDSFTVEEPTKEGYTFVGWEITGMDNCNHYYWDKVNSKSVKFSTDSFSIPGNNGNDFRNLRSTGGLVTFTAKWESTHTHNYTETVTKKATCTTDGLKTFTCVCGDTYTETIKATGHKNTIFITELKPTCTEPGSEDEYCLDCSELVGTHEIPALGHDDSGEWIVEKAATCTENGSKVLYCKRCTEKIDTVSIPALGHNFVLAEKNEKHPHNELYKCTRCPETKTVDSVYSEICPECNFTSTAIDAQSCKITGYTGELSSLTVPAELGGKKVVSTATSALKANAKLTEVRFEDGITEIGSLTFMNCSSLKKVVVPASVTTIGTYAFYGCAADFAIYCFRDSYAHQYAVDNNIDFVLMDIAETKNSIIDYTHKLIFTQFTMAADMSVLIGVPKNVVAIPQASVVNGNRETFGTGSTVTVFENNTFSGEYTVIVNGDLDGDSVCDVLDMVLAERAASGHTNLSDAQAYAANNSADTEIDAQSYQNVVNRALGA